MDESHHPRDFHHHHNSTIPNRTEIEHERWNFFSCRKDFFVPFFRFLLCLRSRATHSTLRERRKRLNHVSTWSWMSRKSIVKFHWLYWRSCLDDYYSPEESVVVQSPEPINVCRDYSNYQKLNRRKTKMKTSLSRSIRTFLRHFIIILTLSIE